jgi:hypothetical protein
MRAGKKSKKSGFANANRLNFTRQQDEGILGTISSSLQEGQLNVLQIKWRYHLY